MSFDAQPVLKGKLVELRPLVAADYDDLYAVASDPLIWEQHPEPRYQEPVFKRFFDGAIASGGAFVVLDAATQRVIGTSRYGAYDEEADEVEIGWTFLTRSHWGGQYNGEMKDLMLRHAYRFVSRVVFVIAPDNLRSQLAIGKIGAVRAGNRLDGTRRDCYLYELTREAFVSR